MTQLASQLMTDARDARNREIAETEEYEAGAYNCLTLIAIRDLNGETLPDDGIQLAGILADLELSDTDFTELQRAIVGAAKHCSRLADCNVRLKSRTKYSEALTALRKRHETEMKEAIRDAHYHGNGPLSQRSSIESATRDRAIRFPYLYEPITGDPSHAVPIAAIANFTPPKPLPPPAPVPKPEVTHASDKEPADEVEQSINADPPAGSRHRPKAKHSPSDLPGVGVRQQ